MRILSLTFSLMMIGCGSQLGGIGDPCEVNADCEEGLECHLHDGELECEEPHSSHSSHHSSHSSHASEDSSHAEN
jgi:hypothetical protein